MPHSLYHHQVSPSFSSWPSKDAPAPRTLPPPPSYIEAQVQPRQPYSSGSGPLTPPPTTQMASYSSRQLPELHYTHHDSKPDEMSYPIRTQVPSINHPPAPYSYNSEPPQSDAAQNLMSTMQRSPPSTLSTLVLPVPTENKKSPQTGMTLKLPNTIRAPQANLSQLAAEVTCLFWFESGRTLTQIEHLSPQSLSYPPICADSIPIERFRHWVANLLSTTQVTQNVIILALYFIWKLKSFNPTVKGRPGSEFRLLTVALMLGNKFLDDNTYTNKTWAEVSGISVKEVRIMEVEFLSNMRLGIFGSFIDRVARSPRPAPLNLGPMQVPASLPSPPGSNGSPPFHAHGYSPNSGHKSNTPILLPQINSTAVSPIGPLPELDPRFGGRKRSYDENGQEPPSKRHTSSYTLPHLGTNTPPLMPVSHHQQNRVPLPSLSIPSVTHAQMPVQTAPQLPPPGGRAMALVYPPPVQWPQQQATSLTSIPPIQAMTIPQHNAPAYDQSRQLSPYPGQSADSSPVSTVFTPTGQATNRLSPSYFLQQRSSPYRPVRNVQTLRAPPVSGSIWNAPMMVAHDQMQYHSLGRPMSERRVGHLPYMHHEAWPETHQFNHWPALPPPPQPIFR
ncbi:hypothetical protein BLS_002810 [Venturia inaequalis]|uniref:Uncharacterized protein n=1 Tax=Venturia inaequalis TaxID=5025 RepID=A0A8H3VAM0_VENIN|nr:hypothetical protein EG328_008147 [Venturia inaequalis]KAE9984216.1 hypothetical protein BLS_002810 [Venturia inaequalis]